MNRLNAPSADTVVIYGPAIVRQLNAGLARYVQQRDNVYLAVDSDPGPTCGVMPQAAHPSVRSSVFSRGLADVTSNIVSVPVMSVYDNLTRSVDGDGPPSSHHTHAPQLATRAV